MAPSIPVYLETGAKRSFAVALEWPGWSRSGRDEFSALERLAAYAPRYAQAIADAAAGPPEKVEPLELRVVERVDGGSGTDFGTPSVAPSGDREPMDEPELSRMSAILQACWSTFDRIAAAAIGRRLAKGPRGGGRELDAIVRHVLEAEQAYLAALGGRYRPTGDAAAAAVMAGTRAAVLDTLAARVRGDPLPPSRRTAPLWWPRYFVRRSAWHALDHAWEIEDRIGG